MTADSYKQALAQAQADLSKAVQERAKWTKEIARLEQLVKSLTTSLIQTNDKETVAEIIGVQELVFSCVCSSQIEVGAVEIRDWLDKMGYDLGKYKNPLAVIHSALNRLARAGQILQVTPGRFAAVAIIRPKLGYHKLSGKK